MQRVEPCQITAPCECALCVMLRVTRAFRVRSQVSRLHVCVACSEAAGRLNLLGRLGSVSCEERTSLALTSLMTTLASHSASHSQPGDILDTQVTLNESGATPSTDVIRAQRHTVLFL